MEPEDQKLFNEFNSVSDHQWWEKVRNEFADLEKLHWKSYEDIIVKPIYSPSELNQLENKYLYQENFPRPIRKWLLIDEIDIESEQKANLLALESLKGGSDGVNFILSGRKTDIKVLLEGIWLDNCFLTFTSSNESPGFISEFLNFYINKQNDPKDLRGIFIYDPLSIWWKTGILDAGFGKSLAEIYRAAVLFPLFKTVTIDTGHFYNSGANAVQELALALAIGVEYIEALKKEEIEFSSLLQKILFSFTCGTNYFFEIAKLRAFRHLWAKALEAFGFQIDPSEISIHCKTSEWNKSTLDQENNIIRNAAESMAAVLGGCDFLTISPYSIEGKLKESTQKRISRNISHILKEEAFLDKVIDPAAGSYYVEILTNQLVERSWSLFLEIESKGGFIKAVQSGFISSFINKVKERKINAIDQRKDQVIGTNIFVNLHEMSPIISNENYEGLIHNQRSTEGIEELRSWVEHAFVREGNLRAKATIINIKNESISKEKASFLKTLFTSIGFEVSFEKNLKEWYFDKKVALNDLIVIYIDSEKIPGKELEFFEQFVTDDPVIITSPQRIAADIGLSDIYIPLDSLALHQNLGRILSNIKVQKK